jgi:hypothetical protein
MSRASRPLAGRFSSYRQHSDTGIRASRAAVAVTTEPLLLPALVIYRIILFFTVWLAV